MRLGEAICKYSKKLPQQDWIIVYFDKKFDHNNNFSQRNTGN